MVLVSIENVHKVFRARGGEVRALDGIDLDIGEGEFVVLRGPSGSGKTTLLLAVGGMQRLTSGRVTVGGSDVYSLTEPERARFRARNVGFVFQMFHLVPYLTLLENVLLASRVGDPGRRPKALDLLERFGLSDRVGHKPAELSAGEKQRAAIARALINDPKIVLADEPTGNLDPENAEDVIGCLSAFHKSGGTVLVVTHGTAADRHADRVVRMRTGRVEPEGESANA